MKTKKKKRRRNNVAENQLHTRNLSAGPQNRFNDFWINSELLSYFFQEYVQVGSQAKKRNSS